MLPVGGRWILGMSSERYGILQWNVLLRWTHGVCSELHMWCGSSVVMPWKESTTLSSKSCLVTDSVIPPSESLTRVHGFPIMNDTKLAYYSSHGNILLDSAHKSQIQMALVIIHGAGRNADDYYCSATAAVELQKKYPTQSVLVVVPRFPSTADPTITLHEGGIALRWADDGDGPWRYGANSVYPPGSNVSSFDTVDQHYERAR